MIRFSYTRGNRCWYSDLEVFGRRYMIDVGHRFNAGPWRIYIRRAVDV